MENIWRSEFRSYHIPHHTNCQKLRKRQFLEIPGGERPRTGKTRIGAFCATYSRTISKEPQTLYDASPKPNISLFTSNICAPGTERVSKSQIGQWCEPNTTTLPPCINYKQTRTGRGAEGNTMYRNPLTGTESQSVHTGSALCATAWYVIRIRSFRRWRRRTQYEVTVK